MKFSRSMASLAVAQNVACHQRVRRRDDGVGAVYKGDLRRA